MIDSEKKQHKTNTVYNICDRMHHQFMFHIRYVKLCVM